MAILTTPAAIGGAMAYRRHETEKATVAAAKRGPFSSNNYEELKSSANGMWRSGKR